MRTLPSCPVLAGMMGGCGFYLRDLRRRLDVYLPPDADRRDVSSSNLPVENRELWLGNQVESFTCRGIIVR